MESPPHSADWPCDAVVGRRSAARLFAAEAAREGSLQRGRALDVVCAGLCRDHEGLLPGARHGRHAGDGARRRQVRGHHAVEPGRHRAHRPGVGDLRSEQRFTGQDSDLLRPHRHRRLHAGRAREGRQIRLEHAQGQGDPGLPARQHAAAVSGGGAASERARSAKGCEAHEQCRHPGARGILAGGPEPIRHLHRAGCRAARARRQGALHGLDRRDRGICRLHHLHGDGQIYPREQRDAAELDRRNRQGHEMDGASANSRAGEGARAVLSGRRSQGDGRGRRTLPPAEDLEDLAGDRAGGPWRSSRTFWCKATCSSRASA